MHAPGTRRLAHQLNAKAQAAVHCGFMQFKFKKRKVHSSHTARQVNPASI